MIRYIQYCLGYRNILLIRYILSIRYIRLPYLPNRYTQCYHNTQYFLYILMIRCIQLLCLHFLYIQYFLRTLMIRRIPMLYLHYLCIRCFLYIQLRLVILGRLGFQYTLYILGFRYTHLQDLADLDFRYNLHLYYLHIQIVLHLC